MAMAGKDATEEFNMIHPPGVVAKYAPDSIIGKLGSGGGGGGGGAAADSGDTGPQYTLEEVAKHNTQEDAWVAINGNVHNVTKFIPNHPGGVLAIMTMAGKDATEEFNMIHPPGVIQKYAPDTLIGKVGSGGSGGGGGGGGAALAAAAPEE